MPLGKKVNPHVKKAVDLTNIQIGEVFQYRKIFLGRIRQRVFQHPTAAPHEMMAGHGNEAALLLDWIELEIETLNQTARLLGEPEVPPFLPAEWAAVKHEDGTAHLVAAAPPRPAEPAALPAPDPAASAAEPEDVVHGS